jgi:hypothetical protein
VISISKLDLTIVESQDGVVVGTSTFVDDYLFTDKYIYVSPGMLNDWVPSVVYNSRLCYPLISLH